MYNGGGPGGYPSSSPNDGGGLNDPGLPGGFVVPDPQVPEPVGGDEVVQPLPPGVVELQILPPDDDSVDDQLGGLSASVSPPSPGPDSPLPVPVPPTEPVVSWS